MSAAELRRMINEYDITHMHSVKTIVMGALIYAKFRLGDEQELDFIKDEEGKAKPVFEGIPIEVDYKNREEIKLK